MGAESHLERVRGQRFLVVETNALKRSVLLKEFFEANFIFTELCEILFGPELPGHISGSPKARVTIIQSATNRLLEHRKHVVYGQNVRR